MLRFKVAWGQVKVHQIWLTLADLFKIIHARSRRVKEVTQNIAGEQSSL